MGWPSLLGHRDGCLSYCQERVSLDRGAGLVTTRPRSLHTRGGNGGWAPEDWSNLCLPLALSLSAHHLFPLTPPARTSNHGSCSVTTDFLPALWARTKENGSDRDPLHPDPLSKRPCTLSPAQRYSPSNGLPHPTPPHYRLEDMALAHHSRDPYRHPDPRELRERHRQLSEQCSGGRGCTWPRCAC